MKNKNVVLHYDLDAMIAKQDAVPVPVPAADRPADPPSGSPGGRPSKCTPELIQTISHCIYAGLTFRQTCAAVDITEETLRVWRRDHPALRSAINKAEAQAVADRLAMIQAAGAKSWRAAAWWLERKHHKAWAQTNNLTCETKDQFFHDDQVQVNENQLTPMEVNLRIALDLPITATEKDVHNALVRKKINLARSRLWNIPVDQLPK